MNTRIKVGFCVAYDWYLLKNSLPLIYDHADIICISIDKSRNSWAGNKYSIDEKAFYSFLKENDTFNKIQVYEDSFFISSIGPMENEVRQRNMLAGFMGEGGWHIQLDTDEYFINFEGFVKYLKQFNGYRKVNICCPWLTLFKSTETGFFIIKNTQFLPNDFIPIATQYPLYEFGRKNGYFNVKTNFFIVHQSWARKEEEVLEKIKNWGHKQDFDNDSYFNLWEKLNDKNFQEYKNFHPINPNDWQQLSYLKYGSIPELINYLKLHNPFKISKYYLKKENSIWFSRLKALVNKF